MDAQQSGWKGLQGGGTMWRKTMRSGCLRCLVVCGMAMVTTWVQAAEPSDIAKLVRELGSSSFVARQRARAALAQVGWDARAELEKAAKDPDPEVAQTARELLGKMLPGVNAETPENVRKLARQYTEATDEPQAKECVDTLFELRPFPHGEVLALAMWSRERPWGEKVLQNVLSRAAPICLNDPQAYEAFQRAAIEFRNERWIDVIANRACWRGEAKALRERAIERLAAEPTLSWRSLLVRLDMLLGRKEEALRLAKQGTVWDEWFAGFGDYFIEDLCVRMSAWDELAAEVRSGGLRTSQAPPRPGRDAIDWGDGEAKVEDDEEIKWGPMGPCGRRQYQLAMVLRLAGREEEARDALAGVMAYDRNGKAVRLIDAAGPTATAGLPLGIVEQQGLEREYVLPAVGANAARLEVGMYGGAFRQERVSGPASQCLLGLGFTADAIQVFVNEGDYRTACDLLFEQRRYEEADRLLREFRTQISPDQKLSLAAYHAGVLWRIRDPRGRTMARELFEGCFEGEHRLAEAESVRVIVRALDSGGCRELLRAWGDELFARVQDGEGEKLARELVWEFVGPCWDSSLWWDTLAELDPQASALGRFARLRKLCRGELAAAEVDEILESALRRVRASKDPIGGLVSVVRMAAQLGRKRDAERVLALAT